MTQGLPQPQPIDLMGGYNPIRSPALNNQTAFNCFVFDKGIFSTPGHKKLVSVADTGEARGLARSDLKQGVIFVIDDGVFFSNGTSYHRLFSLNTITGSVFIAENSNTTKPSAGNAGGQILISDGVSIYIYTLDGKVRTATIDFKPGMLTFQDDYFFIVDFEQNRLYASGLNDGGAWPADSYTTIESITTGLVAFERMLIVFGKSIGVIFHDAAISPFPYTRDITRSWEYGCVQADSIAVGIGVMCWLGGSKQSGPVVLASDGGDPTIISTPGIDHDIENLSNPADCHGFLYQIDGYTFYQLNFNTDNYSILYNFDKKLWYRVSDYQFNLHPIRKVVYNQEDNTMLGISNADGNLYEFSSQIYNENGQIVPRVIISNNLTNQEMPATCLEVSLPIEQGVNRTSTQVALSVSKDNGRTFKQVAIKEIGVPANRKNVLRFRKLGTARWWTFKIEFFSLERMVILDQLEGYFL